VNASLSKQPLASAVAEVFRVFLKLGLTSFGGPIAHLGYYRNEFVVRRKWLDESSFADLVALCQFLPGPASSQVAFAVGLSRVGFLGGLAAWVAFTTPSALALLIFAYCSTSITGPIGAAALHGLMIVAVAVVAQAVWGMARTLAPDWQRATIALGAALIVVLAGNSIAQLVAIAFGGVGGFWFCREAAPHATGHLSFSISRRLGIAALVCYFLLLGGLPILVEAFHSQTLALFEAFYRSGALVFGGGHVVLPLLQAATVDRGWVSNDVFLAGYGATQAVPGPVFTFAAYLGAVMNTKPNGLLGAVICLVAIFLPGMLILVGTLPFWDKFRRRIDAQATMRGINAAVVGLLAAALYNPIWTSAIHTARDFGLALTGFILLTIWKLPPWIIVIFSAGGAVALAIL
jgi:chromate transporter